jgi:hypothetical protein
LLFGAAEGVEEKMEEQLFGTSLRITTGNNNNNNNRGTVSKRESVCCQQFQQYAHQLDAVVLFFFPFFASFNRKINSESV